MASTSDKANSIAAHEERAESVGRYRKIPDDETKPLDWLSQAVKKDAFQIVSLVLVTTFFTVCWACFPGYVKAVNEEGSVYGALVFIFLFSSLFLWILVAAFVARYAASSSLSRSIWKWKGCRPQMAHFKIGFLWATCALILAYARDRNRVLCHMQEPLSILLLPLTFFLGIAGSRLKHGALIYSLAFLLSAFFGLFLSVDAQLLDESYCFGTTDRSERDDQDPWSTETHNLWAIAYVLGVALFAHLHNQLKKFLLEEVKMGDLSDDKEVALLIRTKKIYQRLGWSVVQAALILTIGLLVVLAYCWTDAFDALGKSGSISQVGHLMVTTFCSHFRLTAVAAYGWPIIISSGLFLAFLVHSLAFCRAETLVLAELFAIPLTILGMAISHGFSVETGFAAVGLLVLAGSVAFCYCRRQLFSSEEDGTYSEI